jgi:ribonuclease MRP protein subunit RMP1
MSHPPFPDHRAKETLTLELSLLHILHHRNKNQHRLQPFFKHLSILKRTLGHLLENPESGYLLRRMSGVVVPCAWEEFSRVVARGEFVTLGVVLCACTARIGYCLGGVEGQTTLMEGEVDVEETEEEVGEVVLRDIVNEAGSRDDGQVSITDGFGWEVRLKDEFDAEGIEVDVVMETMDVDEPQEAAASRMTVQDVAIGDILPPAKRRKKKKVEDDIDKLFAGLS